MFGKFLNTPPVFQKLLKKILEKTGQKLLACLNLNILLPYFLKKYIPENKLLPKSLGY